MVASAAASWGTWSLFLRPSHLGDAQPLTSPIMFFAMGLAAVPLAIAGTPPVPVWDPLRRGCCSSATRYATRSTCSRSSPRKTTRRSRSPCSRTTSRRSSSHSRRRASTASRCAVPGPPRSSRSPAWRSSSSRGTNRATARSSARCSAPPARFATWATRSSCAGSPRASAPRARSAHASLLARRPARPESRSPAASSPCMTARGLGIVAIGGVFIGAGAGILSVLGLTRIGSARTAILTYAEPLVAVAIGALVRGEPLHAVADRRRRARRGRRRSRRARDAVDFRPCSRASRSRCPRTTRSATSRRASPACKRRTIRAT